ncbi:hypothetical protein R3W88_020654 [Solanum pinnatisectum]|uniref:Uncharacterized protein n=1 Tax=Solanum pinnatisectum TaxID=50273 RepID=A0AAV9KS57_9SOLN|nr:hypothetical protein R3W88_020654 [Solanum pinnatisectum]
MAAVYKLQSLLNKTSLRNLIHSHLLRPAATAAIASADASNISPQFQPKSILTGHFSDGKKLSVSNADEFLLNWNFPIGIGSALPAFDLSLMELRGSRSTSSKTRPDLEDVEDDSDDEDNFDDSDDDEPKGFDDVYGSCDDSDEDDDDYGRRGGSRGGGAYTA